MSYLSSFVFTWYQNIVETSVAWNMKKKNQQWYGRYISSIRIINYYLLMNIIDHVFKYLCIIILLTAHCNRNRIQRRQRRRSFKPPRPVDCIIIYMYKWKQLVRWIRRQRALQCAIITFPVWTLFANDLSNRNDRIIYYGNVIYYYLNNIYNANSFEFRRRVFLALCIGTRVLYMPCTLIYIRLP